MWVLGIASAIALLVVCSSEENTKWSKPATAERRQGDWVPLSPPCLNCPLEQIHDGTILSSVLTPPQQNNVIPRGLLQQDTSHALGYQQQNRQFQQNNQQSEKFLPPQLIQPQPFLQNSQIHAQNQYLAQSIPPQLINQQFLQQSNQFLPPNPLVDPSFLNQQNQFIQQGMHHLFHGQVPQIPYFSGINQADNSQETVGVTKETNTQIQNLNDRPSDNNRQNYNRSTSSKESPEKEREEVQILYVPVETLKQRGRTAGRVNQESQLKFQTSPQISKETRNQNQNKKFRHPIQPLKDLIPASQLKQYESQTLRPQLQTFRTPEEDSKPLHSINNQDYITPSNIPERSTIIPVQQSRQSSFRNPYTQDNAQGVASYSLQNNQETNHQDHTPTHEDKGQFRQPHRHRTSQAIKPVNSVPDTSNLYHHTTVPYQEIVQPTLPPPNQPPLSVYMETSRNTRVGDVLGLLKGAKTIPVLDNIGPDSPQIFVGPSNLTPPEGYVKFELPYLSSLDGNRIERRVEQLPFFVAPLNFEPPPGYSKIPFPAPHIGSVVVSNATSLQTLQNQPLEPLTIPDIPTVTFRDPYTIPVDISPISPQLPSLINSLQEDKYSLTPTVDNDPTQTTTSTSTTTESTTIPPRTFNSRRTQYRGSQRGYSTSSTTASPRKSSSRQRRPTSNRNPYSHRRNPYTEPATTTTQHPTPNFVEETEPPIYTPDKIITIAPAYGKEEQDFSQNQQINQFSNVNNLQPQYKVQQVRGKFQHDLLSYNQNEQNQQFIPQRQSQYASSLSGERESNYESFPKQEPENIPTTTEVNIRLRPTNSFDTPKEISPEIQPINSQIFRETSNRQRYPENARQQAHIANIPEHINKHSLSQDVPNVYLKEINDHSNIQSNLRHSAHQSEIQHDIFSPQYSSETSDAKVDVEHTNSFNQGKVVAGEDDNTNIKYSNDQYHPQHNYDNTQAPIEVSQNPREQQSRLPLRGQFNQQQNNEQSSSFYSQETDATVFDDIGKNHPPNEYESATPSIYDGNTAHGLLQATVSTESYIQETTSKPTTLDENLLNQRVTNQRLTRFRSRGRTAAERKPHYDNAATHFETETPSTTPYHHTTETATERTTPKQALVRVRGRVRGRTRSQLRQITTTEAPNYPTSRPTIHNANNEYLREQEEYPRVQQTTSSNEYDVSSIDHVSDITQASIYSEVEQTSTVPTTTTDRFPSRKHNFRTHRRPLRPTTSSTTSTTTTTTAPPGARYLIRTRKPIHAQTRLQTGRGRIRRPTTSTTTTTEKTTTEYQDRINYVQMLSPSPVVSLQPVSNTRYVPTENYDIGSTRANSQSVNLSTFQEDEIPFTDDYQEEKLTKQSYETSRKQTYNAPARQNYQPPSRQNYGTSTRHNYETPTRQEPNHKYEENIQNFRQGGSSRLVSQNKDYDTDVELPQKTKQNYNSEQPDPATNNQKEVDDFWNQAVTIQQSKSYVFMPETTILTTPSSTGSRSTDSTSARQPAYDYDDYFNYQESSQYSTSDQSPFPSNEQHVTYSDVKPIPDSGKSSQYPEKKLNDKPYDDEGDIYEAKNHSPDYYINKEFEDDHKDHAKDDFLEKTSTEKEKELLDHISTEEADKLKKDNVKASRFPVFSQDKKTGRRRGAWVRVRVKKPKDVFVTAESQSFGSVSSNSLQTNEKQRFGEKPWSVSTELKPTNNETDVTKDDSVLKDKIENEITEVENSTSTTESTTEASTENYGTTIPNLTTDNSLIETTTSNSFLEDIQNYLTTTEENPTPATPTTEIEESKVLGTSTTTEISLETEICYRGRCVKTKRVKGTDSSDLMPVE